MKSQEIKCKVRWSFTCVLASLILHGLLCTISVNLAADDMWTKRADMPAGRFAHSTSVVNGRIYAIGGMEFFAVPIPTVEEYDPVTDTWTERAGMPTGRGYFSTSVVDGRIYAIGGWEKNNNRNTALSAVEEYDPATDKWTKKSDMPTVKWGVSASVLNGRIYVIGGTQDEITNFTSVEEYDPMTDTWTRKADIPTGRRYFSSSAVNGRIYAIGGTIGPSLLTVEEYAPGPVTEVGQKNSLVTMWGDIKRD